MRSCNRCRGTAWAPIPAFTKLQMRPSIILVSIGMLAACGGLLYLQPTRDERDTPASSATTPTSKTKRQMVHAAAQAAIAKPTASTERVDTAATSPSSDTVDAAVAPSPATIERWIAQTRDGDPKIRAAAIVNLANAPTAQALPVLREVIDSGEPEVDRHIALRSLHAIALRDGDSSGEVRDAMRRAIYHNDNDGVTQTAQSLLDDVEAAFAEQQPPPK